MSRIIRVFPRRTKCTPDDELACVGLPGFFDQADEVHVSVAFTYDLPLADSLAKEWKRVAPVTLGGPAIGNPEGDFVPGLYLKLGNVITSRGCNNHCWFCKVWRRNGTVRELPITDGWKVHDDNLLACSETHIRAVFSMLARQSHRAEFSSGIEAKLLKPWHVDLFAKLKPAQLFCAYDTPDDLEPLRIAGKMFIEAGLKNSLRAFVLIGYPKDTFENAEHRLRQTWSAGFLPFAMLYKNDDGAEDRTWRRFQRLWCRPAATRSLLRVPYIHQEPVLA